MTSPPAVDEPPDLTAAAPRAPPDPPLASICPTLSILPLDLERNNEPVIAESPSLCPVALKVFPIKPKLDVVKN